MTDRTDELKNEMKAFLEATEKDDREAGFAALGNIVVSAVVDLNRIANALEGINDASEWLTKPVDRADPYRQGKGGGQKSK